MPRAWSEGPRRALVFAASVAAVALVLVAKWAFVGPFVAALGVASVLSVAFLAAAVAIVAMRARLAWSDAILAAMPALALLVVALANTPMPYEAESFAARLPHPEGGDAGEPRVLRPFQAGHPTTQIEWRYQDGRNATALTEEARIAFEAAGWRVATAAPPGDDAYGFVAAERWGFRATCNVWDAPTTRIACILMR